MKLVILGLALMTVVGCVSNIDPKAAPPIASDRCYGGAIRSIQEFG